MTRLHCVKKLRDKNDKIIAYVIQNMADNKVITTPAENVKIMLRNKQIVFDNLKLTSDNRIIDCKENTKDANKASIQSNSDIPPQIQKLIDEIIKEINHSCKGEPIICDLSNGMRKLEFKLEYTYHTPGIPEIIGSGIKMNNQMIMSYNINDIRQTFIMFKFEHLPMAIVSRNTELRRELTNDDVKKLIGDISVLNYLSGHTFDLANYFNMDVKTPIGNTYIMTKDTDYKIPIRVIINVEDHTIKMRMYGPDFFKEKIKMLYEMNVNYYFYNYNYVECRNTLDKAFESYKRKIAEIICGNRNIDKASIGIDRILIQTD